MGANFAQRTAHAGEPSIPVVGGGHAAWSAAFLVAPQPPAAPNPVPAAPSAALTATGSPTINDFSNASIGAIAVAVTFWIPTETIALYAAFISLFGTNVWRAPGGCLTTPSAEILSSPSLWLALGILVCSAISPIIVYLTARNSSLAKGATVSTPWFEMIASVVAFFAWAMYLPNSVVAHCFALPFYATVAPLLFVQAALYVAGEWFGLNPPAPTVTTAERSGQAASGMTVAQQVATSSPLDGPGLPPLPVEPGAHPPVVVANPTIVPVFMGPAWKSLADLVSLRAECVRFIDALIASDTYKALSEYGVNTASTKRLQDEDLALPPVSGGVCVDTDLEALLKPLAASLEATSQTAFVVFNPPGVNVSYEQGTHVTCVDECGFHQSFASGDGVHRIPYAVIAFADPNCPGCTQTRSYPTSIMSIIEHEICEMLTNPNGAEGTGWVASDGREIADNCQGPASTTIGGYDVQQVYIIGRACI